MPSPTYPAIEVLMWWCQDSECDCTQPQADLVIQRPDSWFTRVNLWEGLFRSQAEPNERHEQERELQAVATILGVTLAEFHGRRLVNLDMCPMCGSNAPLWYEAGRHGCSEKDESGQWVQVPPKDLLARAVRLRLNNAQS